jgi:hypothetical protein
MKIIGKIQIFYAVEIITIFIVGVLVFAFVGERGIFIIPLFIGLSYIVEINYQKKKKDEMVNYVMKKGKCEIEAKKTIKLYSDLVLGFDFIVALFLIISVAPIYFLSSSTNTLPNQPIRIFAVLNIIIGALLLCFYNKINVKENSLFTYKAVKRCYLATSILMVLSGIYLAIW